MNIEELREYCLRKKATTEDMPFGPETLIFRVASKIFLLVNLNQVDQLSFNVKCNPSDAINLREKNPNTVLPGYHMNKKHWNTVFANRDLDDQKLKSLIDHSYELVFGGLSRKEKEEIERL